MNALEAPDVDVLPGMKTLVSIQRPFCTLADRRTLHNLQLF
jgi:hypothetical protein